MILFIQSCCEHILFPKIFKSLALQPEASNIIKSPSNMGANLSKYVVSCSMFAVKVTVSNVFKIEVTIRVGGTNSCNLSVCLSHLFPSHAFTQKLLLW